jgi:hypothetical protein
MELTSLRSIPGVRARPPTGYIESSQDDVDFRRKFIEYAKSAKNGMKILTGEFGLFEYDDVKEVIEDARVDDVSIEVYNVRAPSSFIEELDMLGCAVYTGKFIFPDEHYAVFDTDKMIISEQTGRRELTGRGARHGPYWSNNPEGVRLVSDYFQLMFPSKKEPSRRRRSTVEIKDQREEVWKDIFGNDTSPPPPEEGAALRYAGSLDRLLNREVDVERIHNEIRGKT